MNHQREASLEELIRAQDTERVLDLLGKDYDFATDEARVITKATWYGDIALLRYALDNGGSVCKEGMGELLGIAASGGRLALVTLLLERGAPIDAKDKYGETALVRASRSSKLLPVVKTLLKAGADLRGALYAAAKVASAPVVKVLIEAGAPLDEISDDGNDMTPLLAACSTGKKKGTEAALMLLKAGANASYVRKDDDMSALKFALWGQCSQELLEELIARGAPLPEEGFSVIKLV